MKLILSALDGALIEAWRTAVEDHLLDGYRLPKSWAEASERHQQLYTDRPERLQ